MPVTASYIEPPTKSPSIPPAIVPTPGIGIRDPKAAPRVAPTDFAAALPRDSPIARETTKSIRPPTTGIRLKIGRKVLSTALVPLLPRVDVSPFLARLVAPDLAYLPPSFFIDSFPNLCSAAFLPYL